VAHGARSGVLTTWDMGHMILGVGRRPVIAAGFGPWDGGTGYAEETAIWSRGERDLYALMDRRDLGWVAAGAATFHQRYAGPDGGDPFMPGADGRGALNLAYFRALPLAALTLGGSGLADAGIRHLGELRPVFAGEQGVDNLAFYLPRLFLFERVRGVRLTGEAPPETRVIARAEIPPRLPYEAWTDSGQDGRWEIVFPVASETVRVAGVVVRVGESDVREGRIIAVPKSH
jgi:hypothetical protein